jgi:hypothetical protein
MTETGTDRRRKRSRTAPPSPSKALSRVAMPLVLSACFIVSVLQTFSIVDTSSRQHDPRSLRLDGFQNPDNQQQRRLLINEEDGEGNADAGVGENLWHRQLRARKEGRRRNRQRPQGKTPPKDEFSRSMAVVAEDATDVYADGDRTRRMAATPRYVSTFPALNCVYFRMSARKTPSKNMICSNNCSVRFSLFGVSL